MLKVIKGNCGEKMIILFLLYSCSIIIQMKGLFIGQNLLGQQEDINGGNDLKFKSYYLVYPLATWLDTYVTTLPL